MDDRESTKKRPNSPPLSCNLINLYLFYAAFCLRTVSSFEAVLMDTRTALSDLGWTSPADSAWQEMTSSDDTGNQRRMLMVCQIHLPHQNNWIRSRYIPILDASRIYVEIEFSIRSCEGISQVATCKETFNLYYYETDQNEATSTFPPWTEEAYNKVDTIAADQRFGTGSKEKNFEVRDIGPLTKNGIYLALQDTGACVAVMYVRVYYMYCGKTTTNLATFPRTAAGPDVTSLVEEKGVCVSNAVEESSTGARLHCNGRGVWKVPSGSCVCKAGYTPNQDTTTCEVCRPHYYKVDVANTPCKRCPDYSLSGRSGATICECMEGYYRSPMDDPELPCSKPPSSPTDLLAKVNGTTLRLKWGPPKTVGGRPDLSYRILCQSCDSTFNHCDVCGPQLRYTPARYDVTVEYVVVSMLRSLARYKFKVCAVNGVSSAAAPSGASVENCVEARIQSSQSAHASGVIEGPTADMGLQVDNVIDTSFSLTWRDLSTLKRPIREYQVVVYVISDTTSSVQSTNSVADLRTRDNKATITGLRHSTLYTAKVRAITETGYEPFSSSVRVKTTDLVRTPSTDTYNTSTLPHDGAPTYLILAIVGGIVFLLTFILIFVACRRKRMRKSMLRKHEVEMQSMKYHDNHAILQREFKKAYKTYVDPSTYQDPHKAVMDFTREIDRAQIQIEDEIGQGEFSEVFRGRLHPPNTDEKLVAIKTLKAVNNPNLRNDFLNEASIMGQFDHSNVIHLEGVVTMSHPLMIVMEFMENGALDHFLKRRIGGLAVVQLVGMLRNVASGMKYLSDMGYIHRDLAARNILINSDLVCKVSDFGLSRELEDEAEAVYSARGEKIPLRWTAPEAITFHKFTSASDVWSFGIVMWEVMSYGETPYWDMPNQTVMNKVENGNRLPAPVGCPHHLHQLMLDCWKKDRNQRPKFGSLLTSLKALLKESWKLNNVNANESTRNGTTHHANGFLHPSVNDFRDSSRNHLFPLHGSSTPIGNTDSGINEDTDEEAPMLPMDGSCDPVEQTSSEYPSLKEWLDDVGLHQYYDGFVRNGCTSVDQIASFNSSDLTRMGILDERHQVALLNNIQALLNQEEADGQAPPSYGVSV